MVPLGDGLLSGRYGSDRAQPDDSRIAGVAAHRLNKCNLRIVDAVNTVAKDRGESSAQIAIAWIRAQQHRAEIIPIVGVRTPAQLADNLGALKIELTADELAHLNTESAIELGFPHDFGGFQLAYGSTLPMIDNHRPQFEVPLGPPVR
jgi:aryl-alcohol dehydrogenase-like predicted oxidoreductase